MMPTDYDPFVAEVGRLASALDRYKSSDQDKASRADAYFHALKAHSLEDLIRKADRWLATEKTFPKPVEWASVKLPAQGPALATMSTREAHEWATAESRRWEGDPCDCASCREADVHWKLLRFVPDFTAEDEPIHVHDPIKHRTVHRGHWAHGWELKRWYDAKTAFYESLTAKGFTKVGALIG